MATGRIAFLIQAHCNVQQIGEAIRRLERNGHRVFVHYDRKASDDLSAIEGNLIAHRIAVHHAGISQVKATLHLLRAAHSAGPFSHYFLMSGQCFPVNTVEWLEDKINEEDIYLNYRSMPIEAWSKRLDRLESFYFERKSLISKFANTVSRRLPKRNFIKGISMWPYAGSNWWCLPKDVIDYVLIYIDKYPEFHRYMRWTSYSDEVYFHSIISNMTVEDRMKPALFYARFDPNTGRPFVFEHTTFSQIPRDQVFVARKFDSRINSDFLSVF